MTWTTEFDTVQREMICTVSQKIKVVVSYKAGTISLLKNGDVADSFHIPEGYTLSEFTNYMLNACECAKILGL